MKKLFVNFILIFFISFALLNAQNKTPGQKAVEKFKEYFKGKGVNVKLLVEKDIDIEDLPLKNSTFVIIELSKGKLRQQLSFFTDGKYMINNIEVIGKRANLIDYFKSRYTKFNIPYSDEDFFAGNKNSKVKIIYFGDFECPYCKRALKYILTNYKDKVAIYYKHFPLSFHKQAIFLASIYEAGKKVGVNLADFIENVSGTNDEILQKVKKYIPPQKWEKFKKLINSKEIKEKIEKDKKLGAKFGIRGTPCIFINGHRVNGYEPEIIKKFIEKGLK